MLNWIIFFFCIEGFRAVFRRTLFHRQKCTDLKPQKKVLPLSLLFIYLFFCFVCVYQKSAFHRPQTLEYRNGLPLPCRRSVGIGKDPLPSEQQDLSTFQLETPDVTSSTFQQSRAELFVPAYVALHKKVGHRRLSPQLQNLE